MDIIELQKIAKRYGFNNVLSFTSCVEDNDLGEVLFGRDQEDARKILNSYRRCNIKWKNLKEEGWMQEIGI